MFNTTGNHAADRAAAVAWARDLMSRDDWLVLDTETTGIRGAEIVQIGLLWPDGTPALDTLVRPPIPIPADATRIHGITDDDVLDAPKLADLLPLMAAQMHGREIVIYNKGFDQGTLWDCLRRRKNYVFADTWIGASTWTCAMRPYAAYIGERNEYRSGWKWQKLPAGDHSAIGDCKSTLAIIKEMAQEDK